MGTDTICNLVLALPAEEPYFRLAFRNQSGQRLRSLPERLQVALRDPALAGNFARNYALAELPLPEFDWDPAVRHAYDYFLHPERGDENLRLAVELQRPESWFERDVIRALLWCPESTDAAIAEVFQFEAEVVHLFEVLFWSCRDRFDDALYLTQILNGGRSALRGTIGDFGRNLLRVARRTGRPEAVLHAAELSRASEPRADEVIEAQLEELLLGLAAAGQGQALSLVDQYLEEPVAAEWMDDLTRLSLDPHAMAVLKDMVMKDALERLRLQQKLDCEAAAAAKASNKGTSGADPGPSNGPTL